LAPGCSEYIPEKNARLVIQTVDCYEIFFAASSFGVKFLSRRHTLLKPPECFPERENITGINLSTLSIETFRREKVKEDSRSDFSYYFGFKFFKNLDFNMNGA